MKKINLLLLSLLAIALSIYSCGEEDEVVPLGSGQVNFFDLQVGQKSTYREYRVDYKFISTGGIEPDSCYYTGETMVLEVIGTSGDDYLVKEYLSTQTAEEVGEQKLTIAGDEIMVTQTESPERYGPTLFQPRLFKTAPVSSPEVELDENCFTMSGQIPFQSPFAVSSAIINGQEYENLFGYSYDGGVVADGPFYFQLFSEDGILLRSQTNGTFLPFIRGWEND